MRILIYGINFHPELTGTGKYTGEMARWLAEAGHEVDVVTAPPYYPQWKVLDGFSAARYQRHALEGSDNRVQIIRCPLWVPSKVNGATRLLHLASFAMSSLVGLGWGFARKPDLVFVVVPTLLQTPQAVLLSKLTGTPCWLHVQDFEVDAALSMGLVKGAKEQGGLLRRAAWAVESFLMQRFDRVSSITPAMVARLHRKGIRPSRSVLLPNWVSLKHIQPLERSATMRGELGIQDNEIVVLYSGNMGEKQGLELVIEAAALLKGEQRIRFLLAGTGSARDRLERQANQPGNITWLPLQPFEKLSALLGSADIHILPQRADAADLVMPSKLTGMLASGRAIVGTAAADTQLGKVLDKVGVRVDPGDAQGVANAISRLADQPATRSQLGSAGRTHAEETLDQEVILKQFLDHVQDLLESRNPSPRVSP